MLRVISKQELSQRALDEAIVLRNRRDEFREKLANQGGLPPLISKGSNEVPRQLPGSRELNGDEPRSVK